MVSKRTAIAMAMATLLTAACTNSNNATSKADVNQTIVGTTTPFAREAIYFVVTDRFVDGDKSNNFEDQGGDYPTWRLPLEGPEGKKAFVGYMGGDL